MEISKLIEMEKKLAEYNGEDKVISSHEMQFLIEEKRKEKRIVALTSGIPKLDHYIKSFEGGELNVISGLTANGKTLFAQTLTNNFSKNQEYSLWFTYEVQPEQFLNQFTIEAPMFYLPQVLKSNSLDWIHIRVHEAKLKYDISAVFIDHLHFLIDMNRHNISLEIGHVMRTLKKMALQFNVTFFLIAHMEKVKPETEPDNNNLRDSSFTAQEADNVFFIWRLVNTDNEAILKITKNRRYGIMNKKIILIKGEKYLVEKILTEEEKTLREKMKGVFNGIS